MPRKPKSKFDTLLEAQIPRLKRYARALTHDVTRADDLLQSCLTRAIAKQHLYQPGTDLRAWLFTILHNQHVNEVRRGVREGTSVDIEGVEQALTTQPRAGGRLELRDLARALAKLPRDQRQVILMIALEGMTYEQVAEIIKVPLGTVCSRLSRGREALRLLMEDKPLSQEQEVQVTAFQRRRTPLGEVRKTHSTNGTRYMNGRTLAHKPSPPPAFVTAPIMPALTLGTVRERVDSIAKQIDLPQTAPAPVLELTPVAVPASYVPRTELERRRRVIVTGHQIEISVVRYT